MTGNKKYIFNTYTSTMLILKYIQKVKFNRERDNVTSFQFKSIQLIIVC